MKRWLTSCHVANYHEPYELALFAICRLSPADRSPYIARAGRKVGYGDKRSMK